MTRQFTPGDFYEDYAYHPCVLAAVQGDDLIGTSLITGQTGRRCSMRHCGPVHLTPEQAVFIKNTWPQYPSRMHALTNEALGNNQQVPSPDDVIGTMTISSSH